MAERHAGTTARRTTIQVVAALLGLGLLLWGTDALARAGAESLVARNVQSATGAEAPPQVAVRGQFFLLQVIRGAYHEVDVTTVGLTSGPLRIERVESRLTDVRVPFHDVLVQDIRQFAVGRSVERVTLRYEDLSAYLAAIGRPLTLAPGPNGSVTATGSVEVLGQHLDVQARALITASNGDLRISPQEVSTGGTTLGRAAQALLTQRLTLTVPLGTLPFGHELTSVTVTPGAVQIVATGTQIVVRP